MERNDSLIREMRAILRSPLFQRSPSLTRILEYLLSRDLAGDGNPTQYDIAREALGKAEDFNETVDSSVRVQISRLRKALSDYYLTHQPSDGLYVHIRVGEYRLRTARIEIAYPDIASAQNHTASIGVAPTAAPEQSEDADKAEEQEPPAPVAAKGAEPQAEDEAVEKIRSQQPVMAGVAIASLLAVIMLAVGMPAPSEGLRSANAVRQPSSVPYVSLEVGATSGAQNGPAPDNLSDRVERQARELLLKSMVSRLADENTGHRPNYELTITITQGQAGSLGASLILTDSSNKIVSERSILPRMAESELVEAVIDEITSIVSPAGYIVRHIGSEIDGEPLTDFECFVLFESERAQANQRLSMLNRCIDAYPSGEFTPYLRIRKAFAQAQQRVVSGDLPNKNNPEWRTVSAVLDENPDNPYANTLAAKLLIARQQCEEAAPYASSAFSRGRTYPALELAVTVDAYGCTGLEEFREFWGERIARVAMSNPEPHKLLKTYILLGAVISEQPDIVSSIRDPFSLSDANDPSGQFNLSLKAALSGEATRGDILEIEKTLPAYLFNSATRELFMSRVKDINSLQRRPELAL